MDQLFDVVVKGGAGALAGAVLAALIFGVVLEPESQQPAECTGTGIPSDTGIWRCLTPDGTVLSYQGPTMDHWVVPAVLGGLAGAGGSVLLFGRKIGWGNDD